MKQFYLLLTLLGEIFPTEPDSTEYNSITLSVSQKKAFDLHLWYRDKPWIVTVTLDELPPDGTPAHDYNRLLKRLVLKVKESLDKAVKKKAK